jgi:hypothetical protein
MMYIHHLAKERAMVVRTQVYFPESLHTRLKHRAQILNTSMADQVRQAVERYLATEDAPRATPKDPIWMLPDLAEERPATSPSDGAVAHDRYLYGRREGAAGRSPKRARPMPTRTRRR